MITLLDEEKWEEYVNYMMIRNDWLQNQGKKPEYEMYLISSMSYNNYIVSGVFQSVIGLDIRKIQKWFYKQIILKANKNITKNEKINLTSDQLSLYLRDFNKDIEDDFIKYLEQKLGFKELDIKETELETLNIHDVLEEMKSEEMDE